MNIKAGSRVETRNGFALVVSVNGWNSVLIRFEDTGYEVMTTTSHIRSGLIKDKMRPTVCGVGFIGDGPYGKSSDSYTCWTNMMQRCYSESYHNKNKTYVNCEVCEEWQDYQCFADWYNDNYPCDGEKYELDKDIKIDGNLIYSPDSCTFVSKADNVSHSNKKHAKRYRFTSPDGVLIDVINLSEFCRSNDLDVSSMVKVNNGKKVSHKGYTKYEANQPD